jgi:hypothetical protein
VDAVIAAAEPAIANGVLRVATTRTSEKLDRPSAYRLAEPVVRGAPDGPSPHR